MVSLNSFDLLKLHKEFGYIYKKGKNQHSQSVVLFYLPQNGIHKVGFTATKKVGNAVKRNRAKRRLRAMFCKYSHNLKDGTYVFVAKASLIETSHNNFENNFKRILDKSRALNDKNLQI